MNCFTHVGIAAVGMCVVCHRGVCRDCVGRDRPRLVCSTCASGRSNLWGYEYRSPITIGGWPLVHVCAGVDLVTMRPKVAKGVIAIGNIAIGVLAIGGAACGLLTLGGVSVGLAFALGGVALGLGVSVGGVAVGSVAIGGAAAGFVYAIGGAAIGPSVIDGRHCDEAARELFRRWLATAPLPPSCR
jgi:hypothetical protein